jgi:hypothetical protein
MKNFKGIGAVALAISLLVVLALASSCNKPAAAQGKTGGSKAAMNANVDGQKAAAGECSSCPGCQDKAGAEAAAAGDEKPAVENTATAGEAKGECAGCSDCKESGSCGGDCAGKGCENADKKAGECSGGGCEGCPGKDAKSGEEQTEEEKKAAENTSTV